MLVILVRICYTARLILTTQLDDSVVDSRFSASSLTASLSWRHTLRSQTMMTTTMTTVSSTVAKQANTIVPCPPVHASPPATAKQVKFSFPADSEPLVDDKDVPVVPKKTSGIPQDATKLNPSRKKRANGF
jgi:hypothetical protein